MCLLRQLSDQWTCNWALFICIWLWLCAQSIIIDRKSFASKFRSTAWFVIATALVMKFLDFKRKFNTKSVLHFLFRWNEWACDIAFLQIFIKICIVTVNKMLFKIQILLFLSFFYVLSDLSIKSWIFFSWHSVMIGEWRKKMIPKKI